MLKWINSKFFIKQRFVNINELVRLIKNTLLLKGDFLRNKSELYSIVCSNDY